MEVPVVYLIQRDTVRLIPSGRLKDPVLSPLAADAGALAALAWLESATHGRLRAQKAGLADLHPAELAFGRPNYTFINAAFTYTRTGGNRFNDESRGAWYCAFKADTGLAEVSFHLTRELAAIGRFENRTEYGELFADFIGPFHDLRGAGPAVPCLDPDPAVGYPAGQALARRLRADGGNGSVYPSVRCPGGTCLAAFRPDLVQNVRQGGLWRLVWQGSPAPVVERVTV